MTSTAAPKVPATHHHSGNARAIPITAVSATTVMTAVTPKLFATSTAHPPQDLVDSPSDRRTDSDQAANGSVATRTMSSSTTPPTDACQTQPPPRGRATTSTILAAHGVSPSARVSSRATPVEVSPGTTKRRASRSPTAISDFVKSSAASGVIDPVADDVVPQGINKARPAMLTTTRATS